MKWGVFGMNNQDMEKIMKKYANKRLSPLRSIKVYCKEMCCAGDIPSWKECSFTSCFLYRYRLGKGNLHLSRKEHSTQSKASKNNPVEVTTSNE